MTSFAIMTFAGAQRYARLRCVRTPWIIVSARQGPIPLVFVRITPRAPFPPPPATTVILLING